MASRFYLEYEGILDGNWDKTIWDVYDAKYDDMIMGQLIALNGQIIDVVYEPETNEEQKKKLHRLYAIGKYIELEFGMPKPY